LSPIPLNSIQQIDFSPDELNISTQSNSPMKYLEIEDDLRIKPIEIIKKDSEIP